MSFETQANPETAKPEVTKPEEVTAVTPVAPTPAAEPKNTIEATLSDGSVVINGKVYKTVEEIEKKVVHADKHIETIETENKEKDAVTIQLLDRLDSLEGKIKQATSVEDLLAELKSTQATTTETTPAPVLSKEEIVEAAKDAMKADALAEKQEANLQAALQAAETAYGEDYGSTMADLAAKRDMSLADVDFMAKNNPTAFRELFLPQTAPVLEVPDTTSTTVETGLGLDKPPAERFDYVNATIKQRSAYVQQRLNERKLGA